MNIWIDVCHTPQFNFFKPVIEVLSQQGHVVYLTVLDRGKTPKIVQHEVGCFPNVKVYIVGRHRMTKWSAIIEANLLRIIKFMIWVTQKHIDVALTTSMFPPIIGKICDFPTYTFGDDAQVFDFKIKNRLATKSHMCMYEWTLNQPRPEEAEILRCLKEWAYLNPRTFVPNLKVLDKYGVKPKEYMFLREVTVGTINYKGQESGAILGIKDLIPKGMKVLFSLEEKKRRDEYPDDWILLQEPIEDIHSLIYYAAGLISSGDSMAREAALLGIPAYYLGIRYSMPANAAASKVASLQNQKTMPFAQWIEKVNELRNEGVERLTEEQIKLRQHIDEEFIDINQYMLGLVEGV